MVVVGREGCGRGSAAGRMSAGIDRVAEVVVAALVDSARALIGH